MLDRVLASLRDDLNTAGALGELSEPVSTVNRLLASGKGVDKQLRKRTLARFVDDMAAVGRLLGVFERDPWTYLQARRDLKARRIGLDVAKVERLLDERQRARDDKQWARADELRDALAAMGVKLRDGQSGGQGGGTTWTL